ncbi:PEP/pyruvate-binding domain-containing protein [soil metagenome]
MSATSTPGQAGAFGVLGLIPLSDAAGRHAEVGSKAANLGTAMAAGFAVPEGIVITAQALEQALGRPPDEGTSAGALDRLLEQVLARLGEGPLAARSSALAEDLDGASYAGQYETVLGIEGHAALAEAVRHCWESASAARVVEYQEQRGQSAARQMAVLVQKLVPADASGVAFTANPVTGERDETLVSAVRGLGDRLVSGLVTPDEWVVPGERAEARGGQVEARHQAGAIDAVTARSAATLARQLEALFGAPQDVEWALAGDTLWLLQARPITALPHADAREGALPVSVPADPPAGFWEREASHFPRPLSPMTRSLELATQNRALASAFAEHGLLPDGLEFREIGGWVYTRVVPPGGKERPMPPRPLMWLLVRTVPQLRSRVAAARRAVREGLSEQLLRQWDEQARPELEQRIEQLRGVDVGALDDGELLEHWQRVRSLFDDGLAAHFRLHAPIALARFGLVSACRELFGWNETKTFELLNGLSTMSTLPAEELAELGTLTGRPGVHDLVERADREAVQRLPEVDPEFATAFELYQRRYGLRARRYDVADPTLAETPELTLATLRDQLRRGYDPKAEAEALAARRATALAEARDRLADMPEAEGERFERERARAELAHRVHEENEFFTISLPLGLARLALLELGSRLAARGGIAEADDVFFLEQAEMVGAYLGSGDQRGLVARRRGERAWVLAHPGPPSYGDRPAQPPVGVLPAEARYATTAMLWVVEMMFAAGLSAQRQSADTSALTGLGASAGRYSGPVRVVMGEHEFDKIQAGDVLVCPITSPVWSVLFSRIGALVTDSGGILSHPAIIAREYGTPAVVATGNGTAVLVDGQRVTVDGNAGVVELDVPAPKVASAR